MPHVHCVVKCRNPVSGSSTALPVPAGAAAYLRCVDWQTGVLAQTDRGARGRRAESSAVLPRAWDYGTLVLFLAKTAEETRVGAICAARNQADRYRQHDVRARTGADQRRAAADRQPSGCG